MKYLRLFNESQEVNLEEIEYFFNSLEEEYSIEVMSSSASAYILHLRDVAWVFLYNVKFKSFQEIANDVKAVLTRLDKLDIYIPGDMHFRCIKNDEREDGEWRHLDLHILDYPYLDRPDTFHFKADGRRGQYLTYKDIDKISVTDVVITVVKSKNLRNK